ncbi:manganese-dependent inorganic pyrophosphatase [Megamonas hypermegale]|uniref:putative manganese-dependent inorganic diphosphatase n=1 Tax=Megamonas hypermegale TaxID=158847 RepID=UPI000B3757C6|nr:putative manganese-dependent inorganic diphosphatase [Megamonas hypermegale]OUO41239.1 manganese-dependent inorganic pyrophosphatase [Megamonas hypermegale]
MSTEKNIYVIGHRNPDTDSICSAIAYANLKNVMGAKNVIAARAGSINKETKYALDYFRVAAPQLVSDIYPRVSDIAIDVTKKVKTTDNLRTLGIAMKEAGLRSVPVVDEEDKLVGMASVSDLAKAYFQEITLDSVSASGASIVDIENVIEAKVLVKGNDTAKITGDIKVIASCIERVADTIKAGEIVIIGNRPEKAYDKCIDLGVSCMIITSDAVVSEEIIAKAKDKDVIVLTTAFDTYSTARLISQCAPVSSIMTTNVVSFKPTDMISDVKGILETNEYRNYPVVENGKLVGIVSKDKFMMPEKQSIIMTDHNELGQAVEGIESGKIIEVVDHHRFGGLQTSDPIFINVRPVGCTCTIVTNMYQQNNVEIPQQIAGLLLSAIISDTVLFKSPTCTQADKDAVEYLAKIAGVDYKEYGLAMLKAGADIGDMTPADIVKNDSKEFQIGNYPMLISQLSVMDTDQVMAMKDEILANMAQVCEKEGYAMSLVIVTDIINEGSYLLFSGEPKNLIGEAFKQDASKSVMYLPGVMSRKKQIVPPLSEAVKRL